MHALRACACERELSKMTHRTARLCRPSTIVSFSAKHSLAASFGSLGLVVENLREWQHSLVSIDPPTFLHWICQCALSAFVLTPSFLSLISQILGLDNAGKTTVLKKFNGEDINTISPTLGFNIKTLEHRGYALNCWDVGGQQTIRSYWRNYFEQTDGLIWVVDSADRVRLNDCKRELYLLMDQEKLAGASLMIFANKQDLAGALTSEEIAEALDLGGERFATRHWSIMGCSAVTGQGLLEGMDWVVDDVSSRIFMLS